MVLVVPVWYWLALVDNRLALLVGPLGYGYCAGPTAVRVHLGRLRAGRTTRDLIPRLRHARQTVLP